MADKRFKQIERLTAAMFGTTRVPSASLAQRPDRGLDAPDFETDALAAQVKHGYRPPSYLKTWLSGINKTAGPGRTGFVIWHGKGDRIEDSYVILRLADFARLVQAPLPTADAPCAPPDSLTDTPSVP